MARKTLLLTLIIVAGALLRFGGLSHDLHEGRIYNPDTPKQMRAVERFLKGQYYFRTGHPDYDGYPYFTAHLVEYVCRAGEPVWRFGRNLIGIPTARTIPDIYTFYWLTLLLNATLATMAIWVVYRIGAENFGPGAGLVAALFTAFSPADVTACHFATGDTAAAFFATVAVLFAFRIYRRGAYGDYAAAIFFAVCGFAAKYHAGAAVFPIVAAHCLRWDKPADLVKPAAWRRVLVLIVVGIAALLVTMPPIAAQPGRVLADIVGFLRHTSGTRRLPPEVRHIAGLQKFVYSMERNLPRLLYILSPPAALAAVLGVVLLAWRERRLWIAASLPVVYFFVGVSFKPLAPLVFHTVMTATVFVIAAAWLTRPWGASRWPGRLWKTAAAALIVLAAGYLFRQAYKETFFAWHMDTRRMAQSWTMENLPRSFTLDRGPYSFGVEGKSRPDFVPRGAYAVRNPLGRLPVPADAFPLKRFALENRALVQFRNVPLDLYARSNAWLRGDFQMPVAQRQPSRTGNQFIFDNGRGFWRSEKVFDLAAGSRLTRRLLREQPLREAWVVVRNGDLPNVVRVRFAGCAWQRRLEPGEGTWFGVPRPLRGFPREPGFYMYRLDLAAVAGPARVMVATDRAELGGMLFNAGLYAAAARPLEDAALVASNPQWAAQALVCAAQTHRADALHRAAELNELARRLDQVTDAATLTAIFGISPDLLEELDFITWAAEDLQVIGRTGHARSVRKWLEDEEEYGDEEEGKIVRLDEEAGRRGLALATPPVLLDPGHYLVSVRLAVAASNGPIVVRMTLQDTAGVVRGERWLTVSGSASTESGFVERHARFFVPDNLALATFRLEPPPDGELAVKEIRLRPEALAEIRALAEARQVLAGEKAPAEASDAWTAPVLMALGEKADEALDFAAAFDCYAAAARLRPDLAAPLAAIMGIEGRLTGDRRQAAEALLGPWRTAHASRRARNVDVRFQRGVRLTHAALREATVPAGSVAGLHLRWRVEAPTRAMTHLAVWVHFTDAQGRTVFQGDHDLVQDLRWPDYRLAREPVFFPVPVPAEVAPGEYAIRVGVYIPSTRRRLKIRASDLPHTGDGVVLPQTLQITAPVSAKPPASGAGVRD